MGVVNIDLGFTQIKGAEIFQSVNPFFVVFLTRMALTSAADIVPNTSLVGKVNENTVRNT